MELLRCWEKCNFVPLGLLAVTCIFALFCVISVDQAFFLKTLSFFLLPQLTQPNPYNLVILAFCRCCKFFIIAVVVSVAFFFIVKYCVV